MIATKAAKIADKPDAFSAHQKNFSHLNDKPVFTSSSKNWHGFGVSKLRLPPGKTPEQFATSHCFAVQLSNSVNMEIKLNGREYKGRFSKGDVSYAPPGVWCGSSWEQEREMLVVSLDPSFVTAHSGGFLRPGSLTLTPDMLNSACKERTSTYDYRMSPCVVTSEYDLSIFERMWSDPHARRNTTEPSVAAPCPSIAA